VELRQGRGPLRPDLHRAEAARRSRRDDLNYPALTVEARQNKLTRVRWINELFDPQSRAFLPHLLPVDRTLHWANPELLVCGDGTAHVDCRPAPSNGAVLQQPYQGPVPIIPHVHGAHVNPESDGYPEAWFLPAASNLTGYALKGGLYDQFDRGNKWPGSALFGYHNTQRASTLWYHDHTLGMTRLNVYAGPAGFWLLRGPGNGEPDLVSGVLPGPAPRLGEDPNFDAKVRAKIREIPIAIQERIFKPDGSLFFPDSRAFFEGLNKAGGTSPTLDIPLTPDPTLSGQPSDVSPIWNPEFFGNTMVVNGTTWPVLQVAPARYRLRLLNGSNARTLMLKLTSAPPDPAATAPAPSALPFHQIGSEGGLLPQVAPLERLLMGPAERADVVVDFSGLPDGTVLYLINEGPDGPFAGGAPFVDFPPAAAATTGQVMKLVVSAALHGAPGSTDTKASPPSALVLAPRQDLVPDSPLRRVSLNEMVSERVFVEYDADGNFVLDPNLVECDPASFVPSSPGNTCMPFGPIHAMVGTVAPDPGGSGGFVGVPLMWTDMSGTSTMTQVSRMSNGKPVMVPVTEAPKLNDTEVWEIWNFTMDAHPIHLHQVQFQVVDRELLTMTGMPADGMMGMPFALSGTVTPPEPWETGWKDTVIAYPGQATRIKARFDIAGLYVWHCHIIDHEDNEMMRPFAVVPDLDRNGVVNTKDLVLLLKDIFSGHGKYDLNGDGKVNLEDALRLLWFL